MPSAFILIKPLILVCIVTVALTLSSRKVAAQTGLETFIHPGDGAVMVRIPAGPFLMGDDSGWGEATPRHEVTLPAFYIDRFEVSIAQFQRFVASGAYTDPSLWDTEYAKIRLAEGNLQMPEWQEVFTLDGDRAMCYIRYIDAAAYCRWAGKILPTAAQWEKAARGIDGRRYPWGATWDPKKARVAMSGMQTSEQETTLLQSWSEDVHGFPEGESPFGVRQMAGNVWEWTLERMSPYPGNPHPFPFYPPFEGNFLPELRGGSWRLDNRFCTTFFRTFNYDDEGLRTYGFRCACENLKTPAPKGE